MARERGCGWVLSDPRWPALSYECHPVDIWSTGVVPRRRWVGNRVLRRLVPATLARRHTRDQFRYVRTSHISAGPPVRPSQAPASASRARCSRVPSMEVTVLDTVDEYHRHHVAVFRLQLAIVVDVELGDHTVGEAAAACTTDRASSHRWQPAASATSPASRAAGFAGSRCVHARPNRCWVHEAPVSLAACRAHARPNRCWLHEPPVSLAAAVPTRGQSGAGFTSRRFRLQPLLRRG